MKRDDSLRRTRGESRSHSSGPELTGRVVAAFGRRYLVDGGDNLRSCLTRGRDEALACGDDVRLCAESENEGIIVGREPRRTLFFRSAPHRQKLLAANLTQVAMVVAAEPSFSDELVTRVLAAAAHAGLTAFVILNKADLDEASARAKERLAPFQNAGYTIVPVSALNAGTIPGTLHNLLSGQSTLLVGQSGMGKSTLLNALIPDAQARTREISTFLDSGKHTTTATRLYPYGESGSIIDSPGMQEFGLAHMEWRDIAGSFVEFRPMAGQCRFPDCRHHYEPGCSVRAAVAHGQIAARRLELYQRITGATNSSQTNEQPRRSPI